MRLFLLVIGFIFSCCSYLEAQEHMIGIEVGKREILYC